MLTPLAIGIGISMTLPTVGSGGSTPVDDGVLLWDAGDNALLWDAGDNKILYTE